MAIRDGADVGRIAAIRNHNHEREHGDGVGFFGFLETENNPETLVALCGAAEEWLESRGCRSIRGPVSYDMNNTVGVLVDGFSEPPAIMMPWNGPWLPDGLEEAGFAGVMDLVAHLIPTTKLPVRIQRLSDRLIKREGITIRTIRMDRFADEVKIIQRLYNAAWEKNWGYVPLTDAEIEFMARDLKPVVDPKLIIFAEVDGEPVGFAMCVPDVNEVLRKNRSGRLFPFGIFRLLFGMKRIRRVRVITLGTLPEYRNRGVEILFYRSCIDATDEGGYEDAECSWILATNDAMNRGIRDALGGEIFKTYRIYEKPL